MTEFCSLKDNSVLINETELGPFQVRSIKIDLLASQTGVFNFEPRVAYVDDSGKAKALEPKPVTITVERALTKTESATDVEARLPSPPTFKSEAAQQTFDYLLDVFWEDYQKLKLSKDKAGWRTLLTIVKMAKVSKYSLYGSAAHKGHALSELERLGLIEARVFSGERGRGGEILKLRVTCETPTTQRLIELRRQTALA